MTAQVIQGVFFLTISRLAKRSGVRFYPVWLVLYRIFLCHRKLPEV